MVEKINAIQFEEKVLKNPKTVVVDFFATWCGPCKMQAPVLEEFSETREDIDIFKIDVDQEGELSARYGIMSIPTLIVFKNGEEVEKHVGFADEDTLEELIK
ncbi:MAG: thioredoxin [Clostridia bacterium]|nr:thioredoxin [Clostridia bacterium]